MQMNQYPEVSPAEFSMWGASLPARSRHVAVLFMIGFLQHDLSDRQRGMLIHESEIFLAAWRAVDQDMSAGCDDSPLAP